MTAPIPVRVLRHACPHCRRTHSRPGRAREHIARCWHNPDARGCKTCKHFEPGVPGEIDTGWPGEMEHCAVDVSLTGRPACGKCGGVNWLPTGETFRPRLATGGPVYAQCTDCGGDGAEIKPGPIVGCDRWQAAPRCQEPTCPDFGDPDFGEGTCPAEHADPAGAEHQAPHRRRYKNLKLYRLKSESAWYDDAREIVVWAHDDHDAREVLKEAFDSRTTPMNVEIHGELGGAAWPYEVTEVKCERGIVLAETGEG